MKPFIIFGRALLFSTLLLLGPCWSPGTAAAADPNIVGWGNAYYLKPAMIPVGITNVVSLSAGGHSMALKADGTVIAWGDNYSGQTNVPAGLSNVVAIAAAYSHSVAVKSDGSVVAWGEHWDGQIDVPPAATNVIAVAVGQDHTLALRRDGTVVAWGGPNYYGETNVPAAWNTNIVGIAAGFDFNLLLRSDGTVVAWGINDFGATNVPPGLSNVVAIAAGYYHAVALKSDGTVVTWGENHGPPPAGLSNVVAISANYNHTLALNADGSVVAWGDNNYGQTTVPSEATNVTAFAAGVQFSLAATGARAPFITQQPADRFGYTGGKMFLSVKTSGTHPLYYQWRFNGSDLPGATNATFHLPNLQLSDAGAYCVVVSNAAGAITSSNSLVTVRESGPSVIEHPGNQVSFPGGTVRFQVKAAGSEPFTYQWQFQGTNIPGATASTLILTNLSKAQAGAYSVVVANEFDSATSANAILSIGAIAAWGRNSDQQCDVPPDLTNVIAIAGGYFHSLALKSDGTVVGWGLNASGRINIPAGLSDVVAIAAGSSHSMALKRNGTVVCWGWNASGQTNVPAGLSNIVAIAAGDSHSLALASNGILYGWGWGLPGGQITIAGLGLTNLVAIAAGWSHNLALRENGQVVSWHSHANIPPDLTNAVAVSSHYDFNLALKSDGTPVAWGSNYGGQTDVPPGLSNVVGIAAGNAHSVALKADGTVAIWGAGNNNQTNIPPGLSNVVSIAAGGMHTLAIVGDGPPAQFAQPVGLSYSNSTFTVNLPTLSGKVYRLEYRDSLSSGEWNVQPFIPGNGAIRSLNTDGQAPQRFYQIRQW